MPSPHMLPDTWMPGTVVSGRYAVRRKLSSGAMGEVYEAHDTRLDVAVALKRLILDIGGAPIERERRLHEACVRMHREASHTSRLGHPGIVHVTDLVYDVDHTPVLVMELLHGVTLQDHLAWSTLPTHVAIDWIAQVLDALAVAHAVGVVHRDLKPDNLFLVQDPALPLGVRVKILDFGVAKHVDPNANANDEDENTALTSANVFMGSYQYAAPEQFDPSRPISGRTDLYAVGVILYRMLTGRHPAGTRSLNDLMLRTLFGNIERSPAAWRRDVPDWLDALTQRALALNPDERPASAEAMRDALLSQRDSLVVARPSTQPAPSAGPAAAATTSSATDARGWAIGLLFIAAVIGWIGWFSARFGL